MMQDEEILTIDMELDPESEEFVSSDKSVSTLSGDNPVTIYESAVLSKNELSLQAQRLLRTVISLIRPTDTPGKIYTFNLSEYASLYGIKGKVNSNLISAAKALIVPIELPIDDGYATSYISKIHIKDNEVMIAFNEDLLPYYKALNNKQYPLINIKQFECSYTFQFYDYFILKLGNKDSCEFEMTIDYMRDWLCLEGKYPMYANFKKRVIEPVLKDLNFRSEETPFNLDVKYIEKKHSRKVVAINFLVTKIKGTSKPVDNQLNVFFNSLKPDTQLAYEQFIAFGITPGTVTKSIKEFGEDKFLKIWYYVRSITKPEQKNKRYIAACIKNGYTSDEIDGNKFRIFDLFDGIEKNLILSPKDLEDIEFVKDFFESLDADNKAEIFHDVKENLKELPLVYKHISPLSLSKLMATESLKQFFFAAFTTMVQENEKYLQMIREYRESLPEETEEDKKNKEERKALIEKLNAIGVGRKGNYLDKLEADKTISNARIKDAIVSYNARVASGEKVSAGWVRKMIDEDYHGIDHPNDSVILETLADKDKNERQKAIDAILSGMPGSSNGRIVYENMVPEELPEAEIKSYTDEEKKELRDYFMNLGMGEKNAIIEKIKQNTPLFKVQIEKKKSYEEMWDDVFLKHSLYIGTDEFRKEKEIDE